MGSGLWTKAAELESSGIPFVAVTMVDARGSVPQEVGARALVAGGGLVAGSVGGGRVEDAAIRRANEIMSGNAPEGLVSWNLQRDIGMTCGGEVTFFFEAVGAVAWEVAIFGAGHVAQAVVRLLAGLGRVRVRCADPRKEWIGRLPDRPNVRVLVAADLAPLVDALPVGTFVASLTQGHATDRPVLARALARGGAEIPYVGVIGSAAKAAVLRRELAEDGVPAHDLQRLRCPIGLPLGNDEPAEIAVSIVAEMLQVRDGRVSEGM